MTIFFDIFRSTSGALTLLKPIAAAPAAAVVGGATKDLGGHMDLETALLEVLKSERAGLSLQKEIQVQEEVWGLQKVRKKYAGGYKKKYGGYKKYDNYRYGGYKKYDDYGYMGGYEPECKQDYGLVVSPQSKYIS